MKISYNNFQPQNPKGFIVLEGVNGSGKSTLQKKLNDWATEQGKEVLCTFEPGGTPLGVELRKLLLENKCSERTPLAEAFLFSADRAEHVETVIRPALDRKQLVLLDRYYYSTIAFQGYGHKTPLEPLLTLSETAISGLRPDIVILLDLDPEKGLLRNSDKSESDSFEQEAIDFHTRLREGFLSLADSLPEPFVIIDAELPSDKVFEEAVKLVSKVL